MDQQTSKAPQRPRPASIEPSADSSATPSGQQPPPNNKRKRSRRNSADEGAIANSTASPSAPRGKKARVDPTAEESATSSDSNSTPKAAGKKKNAKRKQRRLEEKQRRAVLESEEDEPQDDQESRGEDDDDEPVPSTNPAMSWVLSQLPQSSLPATDPGSALPRMPTAEDLMLNGSQQLPEDAIMSLSQVVCSNVCWTWGTLVLTRCNPQWKELSEQKDGLLQYMASRPDSSSPNSYHKRAYKGKVLMDWLHENTLAIGGLINNRQPTVSHAKAIVKSIKAFGHQGHKYPIIIIIRDGDLPADLECSEASPPVLSFLSKTAIGIVAGVHRFAAIKLFCDEADKVIEAANKYVSRLAQDLKTPGLPEDAKAELELRKSKMDETLKRLVQERYDVAHWPTLIYDWSEWTRMVRKARMRR